MATNTTKLYVQETRTAFGREFRKGELVADLHNADVDAVVGLASAGLLGPTKPADKDAEVEAEAGKRTAATHPDKK